MCRGMAFSARGCGHDGAAAHTLPGRRDETPESVFFLSARAGGDDTAVDEAAQVPVRIAYQHVQLVGNALYLQNIAEFQGEVLLSVHGKKDLKGQMGVTSWAFMEGMVSGPPAEAV